MNPSTIICPKCQNKISIDEALSHQLSESLKKEFEEKRTRERDEERREMKQWKENLEKSQQQKEKQMEEKLKEKISKESSDELKFLTEELEKQKQESQKARENELLLRKKTNELEEREKNMELELARKLDSEKEKIRQAASEQFLKEHQLKEAEYKKQTEDMKRKIEELQQKANLTSQQLQGEVQELEIEKMLKAAFPFDEIIEIKKGVKGADTLQVVRDQTGRKCGSILWESKRTKDWENPWVSKLKEDIRKSKADIGIIVSDNLPKEVNGFGPFETIFVSDFFKFIALAQIMRIKIIDLCYAKLSVENKNDKKEILWSYLTGNEFKQRVEVIVDYFKRKRVQIDKEKRYFNAKWAEEEKSIELVTSQTAGMYGDLQGLMGVSLPQIASLEITTTQLYSEETTVIAQTFTVKTPKT